MSNGPPNASIDISVVCLSLGLFLAACSDLSEIGGDDSRSVTVISTSRDSAESKARAHCAKYGKSAIYFGSFYFGNYEFICN